MSSLWVRIASPRRVRGLTGVVGFLVLAEIAIRLSPIDTDYLPPSSIVLWQIVHLLTQVGFLADMGSTLWVWFVGLAIAIAVAVPLGIIFGSIPTVRVATRSLVEFLRPIPPVAVLPLAILLFGAGAEMKLALIVYGAVWPILFNTLYALQEVDPIAKDTARAFGYARLAILWRVSLPSAAPFIATGIRVSASIALVLAVSSGLLAGGENGIGTFIIEARTGTRSADVVMAAAILAGALGFTGNAALERVERRLFQWNFARAEGAR